MKGTVVADPNYPFVQYLTSKSGHLTKQDTWKCPKGVRIRGVPLYLESFDYSLKRGGRQQSFVNEWSLLPMCTLHILGVFRRKVPYA